MSADQEWVHQDVWDKGGGSEQELVVHMFHKAIENIVDNSVNSLSRFVEIAL